MVKKKSNWWNRMFALCAHDCSTQIAKWRYYEGVSFSDCMSDCLKQIKKTRKR